MLFIDAIPFFKSFPYYEDSKYKVIIIRGNQLNKVSKLRDENYKRSF